ncbi:glycosyltransferase family 25 protein [Paracoccus salsus]|uniref:glycosyltransferase family 25 protein n=1 Tax=Paracoccus salsus TaxID=2911061 RepID=UPI001F3E2DDC|nr:glycosyltransferase family 25 protein [Paracoccus salsus]
MAAATITLPVSGLRLAVFLINMEGADQRLSAMRDKLAAAGLPFCRIVGVDGRAKSFPIPEFDERGYRLLHGRRTSPAEIGCYLSHIGCARAFLDGDADLALILEDDVTFQPDFLATLDRAAAHRELWNILRLTTVNRGRKFPVRELGPGRWLAIALTREKGAGAYVIDRRAARWFARDLLPMRLAFDIAFDLEYLHGLRAAFVEPLPASQISSHPTQIQSGVAASKLPRWRYATVLPYRAWLELSRVMCRGTRLVVARWFSGVRHAKGRGSGQKA